MEKRLRNKWVFILLLLGEKQLCPHFKFWLAQFNLCATDASDAWHVSGRIPGDFCGLKTLVGLDRLGLQSSDLKKSGQRIPSPRSAKTDPSPATEIECSLSLRLRQRCCRTNSLTKSPPTGNLLRCSHFLTFTCRGNFRLRGRKKNSPQKRDASPVVWTRGWVRPETETIREAYALTTEISEIVSEFIRHEYDTQQKDTFFELQNEELKKEMREWKPNRTSFSNGISDCWRKNCNQTILDDINNFVCRNPCVSALRGSMARLNGVRKKKLKLNRVSARRLDGVAMHFSTSYFWSAGQRKSKWLNNVPAVSAVEVLHDILFWSRWYYRRMWIQYVVVWRMNWRH